MKKNTLHIPLFTVEIWRKTLLFFLFSSFASLSLAQTIAVSPELTLSSHQDYRFVGKLRDTAVLLLYEEDLFKLALYDDKMKFVLSEPFRPERHNIDILETVIDKDFFSVVYRHAAQGKSSAKILRLNSQGKLLDSLTLQSMLRWGVSYEPTILVSEDRSKLLIYDLSDNNTTFNAVMFDLRTFKILWSRTFRPIGLDYNNALKDAVIDNAGGVYWMLEHENRKTKSANNRFDVVYFTAELSQEWAMSIPLSGRIWQDAMFCFDNKNKKLVATGLYSTKKTSQSEGAFFFALAPLQPQPPDVQFNDFDAGFIQQLTGKEQRGNQGFQDFKLQKLIPRADGGVLMIGEYYKKYVRTMNTALGTRPNYGGAPYDTRTTIDYEYHDLLLASFYPNGTVQWKEMLPKRQFSQDDDALYSSFFLMKNKTGLRFIYNDDIKTGGNNINEYIVIPDGTAQRHNLYNSEKLEMQLIPREARQTSATEVWIPSFRREKVQLLRFNY
ncbi:MAG: hypothetical protein RI894_2084 [Bacteroidota bacterium]|jgi:hypothetical protein